MATGARRAGEGIGIITRMEDMRNAETIGERIGPQGQLEQAGPAASPKGSPRGIR